MNVWKIGILGLVAAVVVVAVFDDSQHQPLATPDGSSSATAAASLAKAESELAGALQDPAKVKVMECLGVKVYEDPQPAGHPPNSEDCKAILASADHPPYTPESGPQNPAIDDAAAALIDGEKRSPPTSKVAAAPVPASDPYATGQQGIQEQRVREGRDYVLETARLIGSAVRCQVIPDYQAAGVLGDAIRSVYHHVELESEARQAATVARDTTNDCSYWKSHPQAVAEMRERGQRAVQP